MKIIMFSLQRQRTPDRSAATKRHGRGAFTLSEIVIALAILGTMASGVYIGFNSINTYAVSTRLYSEANTAAQNQIDKILSKEPFDISAAYISGAFNPALNRIPVELMTVAELDALAGSGVTFPSSAPTATPATTDAYYPYYPYYRDGSSPNVLKKQAFIYRDPVSGNVLVTGVLSSTVTDAGMTMNFVYAQATNLNTRKANVSVTYSFRNKDYNVSIDTLRAADQ